MQEAADAEALEQFLAERGTQLMRTAVLLAGGRQDGEDLMQAALERLLRQGSGSPATRRDTSGGRCTTWPPTAGGGRRGGAASCR